MNTYVRAYPDCLRQAFIKISADEVNETFTKVLSDMQKTFSFPGYRKGKVPVSIIEKNASDELMQRAIQFLVQEAALKLASDGIRFYTEPKLSPYSNLSRDREFLFTMVFEVVPELRESVDVSKLEAEYEELFFDDAMIEYSMKKQLSSSEPVKGKIESSDVVSVRILSEGVSEDEKVFEAKDVPALVGHKKGDTLELSFQDLGAYVFEYLDLNDHSLKVEITEVERNVPGTLDDETVAAATSYKNVEEFRKSIHLQMQEAVDQLNGGNKSQALKDVIGSAVKADFPKSFFLDSANHEIGHFLEESFHVAELSLKELLEDEKIQGRFSKSLDQSYKNVVFILFLDDFAQKNGIVADKERVERVLSTRAREERLSVQEYRKKLSSSAWDQIQTEARREACIEFLLNKVKFKASERKPLIEVK